MEKVSKEQIKEFWNENPCGSKRVEELEEGSMEFFIAFDKLRREMYPYLDKHLRYSEFAGKNVLEIGIGMGADIFRYAEAGASVTGVDLAPKAVELTSRRFDHFGLKGKFMTADAENLPFADEAFDLVVSIGVLHHTPDTQKCINEVYRILKPGGEAVIMLYYRNSYRFKVAFPLWRRFHPKYKGYTQQQLINELYDGAGNPLGQVFSKKEAKKMFSKFKHVRMELENFEEAEAPGFIKGKDRNFYLRTIAKWAGLDLYITARK